jgi:hypothetical protein
MSDQKPQYAQLVTACDHLLNNPKLSLYEEVELLKAHAHQAKSKPGVLNQLSRDFTFLIERLSSDEKQTYLRCCEYGKDGDLWASTEP